MTEFLFKQQVALQEKPTPQVGWRTPASVVAATGLIAVCAHISIPLGFTPVPLTMQTFAVLLLGLLFTPRAAFATMVLYLVEGAAGLPVFSPAVSGGGIVQLLGPTGGYLLCYPFAAAAASSFFRAMRRSFLGSLGGGLLASILILTSGALWLGLLSHAAFSTVFAESVLPFLPGDMMKVVAAALCAYTFDSFRGSLKR